MNRRPRYNKGQWQLTRERFQIADPAPPVPPADAKPLGDFVSGVLKGMNLADHAHVSDIAAAWPGIVGPQIAANSRPAHIDNRLLTVFVSHPAWLMELRGAHSAEILARLQARFGKTIVANLRWSIDPGQAPR